MKHVNQHRHRLLSVATALALSGLGACGKPPAPAAASSAASSAAANVSDIDITEHVKTVLSQTESLKGFDITVVTLKGDVRLTGVLDNQSQIDETLRIARAADGTHAIHDELTLKK
jgi:hyperosmotically inducible periplasmic protein